MLDAAAVAGVRVGAAPDTFLGGRVADLPRADRRRGDRQPVAATAFMLNHGHEGWHPNPDFYYQPGGGPLLDMGPYYLTALVALLGPDRPRHRVVRASFAERTITSQPRRGERIPVGVSTHAAAVLDFSRGRSRPSSPRSTFGRARRRAWRSTAPRAASACPTPNTFGGPVRLRRGGDDAWREVAVDGRTPTTAAASAGRPSPPPSVPAAPTAPAATWRTRARVMHAVETASREGRHVSITSPLRAAGAAARGVDGGRDRCLSRWPNDAAAIDASTCPGRTWKASSPKSGPMLPSSATTRRTRR
jgi:predicted dehydrogenase